MCFLKSSSDLSFVQQQLSSNNPYSMRSSSQKFTFLCISCFFFSLSLSFLFGSNPQLPERLASLP